MGRSFVAGRLWQQKWYLENLLTEEGFVGYKPFNLEVKRERDKLSEGVDK